MEFIFKVVPPSLAIVFLLSPEYGRFLVYAVVDKKIATWNEPELPADVASDVRAFSLALVDATALLAAWLMTTATCISVAIAAKEHQTWAGVLGIAAICGLFAGLMGVFYFVRTLKPSDYAIQEPEPRVWQSS